MLNTFSSSTNVTAQTHKDLNTDVLARGAFFWSLQPSSYEGYSMTSDARVFRNSCSIKTSILGHKVNGRNAISSILRKGLFI